MRFRFRSRKHEEQPMTIEQMKRKVAKELRKKRAQTAGELARKAGLVASNGTGSRLSRPLSELVQDGVAARHGRRGHYSYTRA